MDEYIVELDAKMKRCLVTGDPCGTASFLTEADDWGENPLCDCENCIRYSKQKLEYFCRILKEERDGFESTIQDIRSVLRMEDSEYFIEHIINSNWWDTIRFNVEGYRLQIVGRGTTRTTQKNWTIEEFVNPEDRKEEDNDVYKVAVRCPDLGFALTEARRLANASH